MRKEYLRIDNGKKAVEGRQQLYSVFLQIYKGEVYGILSGDMNEISSLVDIMRGKDCFDYGKFYYKGLPEDLESGREYLKKKVALMDKQSHLVENLSIAENMYIVEGKPKVFFVNTCVIKNRLQMLLETFDIHISVDEPVKHLSHLERCQLELLKAFVQNMECIILDWRKDFLTHVEYENLYLLVEKLKDRGMTFISIDYSVERTVKYSDAVMILNHGKTIQMLEHRPFKEKEIYRLLFNEQQYEEFTFTSKEMIPNQEVVLSLSQVRTGNLDRISLTVERGEIVTIVCEDRKSVEEFVELLKGNLHEYEGRIYISGKKYRPQGQAKTVKQGICFVENHPLEDDLFENMNVYDNICIAKGSRIKTLWWKPRYRKNITIFIEEMFGKNIGHKKLRDLSVLERKKIVYYRWLLYNPNIVVCINPFSAMDIYMSRQIELMLAEYAKRGIGVILLTQDYWVSTEVKSSLYMLEKKQLRKVV